LAKSLAYPSRYLSGTCVRSHEESFPFVHDCGIGDLFIFSKIGPFSVPAMTFILDVLGGPVQQIIMDVCSAIFELCAIL
jgi:hypothetical protein